VRPPLHSCRIMLIASTVCYETSTLPCRRFPRMEAGALTPQQARKLKLAATQSMIARLETLSAAYDGKIASVASARDRCTPESGVSSDATTQGMRSRLTVDIRELKSTATRTARQ